MGHEHSKFSSSSAEDSSPSSERKGSRLARFKNRLHFRRKTTNASSSTNKLLSAGNFTGIALFALLRAEMQFKDKWIACLSLGEQTFRTKSSEQTDKPVWNSEKKLLLEQNGPHIARVSVFEVCSKNN
ncbi:hypothetical protein TSUD_389720 [Trifolium subterraneum]|uniref:C2 domain-containing protein n=1 Tax=Trifolium subterraneum TaxID=3900 RepID=A0A2Z6NDG9_TRISU|nr:hypothetical protein TSUD_389720 [Trifolium subterraneum]